MDKKLFCIKTSNTPLQLEKSIFYINAIYVMDKMPVFPSLLLITLDALQQYFL